jgi:hypothetical protein
MPTQESSCGCATTEPAATALTLSALKAALAAAPQLPLQVLWTDGEPIEAHFHVTEIGRVQRDFVDCGGTRRRVVTCLLQTWVAEDTEHRLTAGKLLKAFAHAAPILGDEDLSVEFEYEACNVVQLALSEIRQQGDRFVLQLGHKHTDCLAREVCLPGNAGSCC